MPKPPKFARTGIGARSALSKITRLWKGERGRIRGGESIGCSHLASTGDSNSKLLCDLRPRLASAAQGGNLTSIHESMGPADAPSFGFRIPEASLHPLDDQGAFQFGDGAEYRENHFAGWCGRV
jgi:hypothetical protein